MNNISALVKKLISDGVTREEEQAIFAKKILDKENAFWEKNKPFMPKAYRHYDENRHYHDWLLRKINLDNNLKKNQLDIHIKMEHREKHGKNKVKMIFRDVSEFNICTKSGASYQGFGNILAFSGFEIMDDRTAGYYAKFDHLDEVSIVFRKVEFITSGRMAKSELRKEAW